MTDSIHNSPAVRLPDSQGKIARVLAYHQLSTHHPHRYAPGPGELDWANQPDPFRTFTGAPTVPLPLLADALGTSYSDLYTPGAAPVRRPDVNSVAILFELALGLSAWKEYGGSRWALRCNPSSGNLHPTEGYAVLPPLPGIAAGVYHYVSRDHTLEQRRAFEDAEAARLAEMLPPRSFLMGLSSIHWREAWKYGVRGFRYCQHDIGHALAAVRYSAAALGWTARLLDHLGDDSVSAWLGLGGDGFAGLDRSDREDPDVLILVGASPLPATLPVLAPPCHGVWLGTANCLSRRHARWEAIQDVSEATQTPALEPEQPEPRQVLPPLAASSSVPAATLIRQRRSCLGLDARTALESAEYYRMLDCLLPRPDVPPWDLLPWQPLVHAAVFVHRIGGLAPGLYLLERSPAIHNHLKAACFPTMLWQRPAGCPEHLAFYLLAEGDYRETARTVSCYQDIASDGAFSLGMFAVFGPTIRTRGAWWYRRMFWEAGALGQVLYLEAEAAGVRGTGIGCYVDAAVHQILGLTGDTWQDLYHFTVGGPVEDLRLRTHAPYASLSGR